MTPAPVFASTIAPSWISTAPPFVAETPPPLPAERAPWASDTVPPSLASNPENSLPSIRFSLPLTAMLPPKAKAPMWRLFRAVLFSTSIEPPG